jgi:hypothetical protein
MTAYIENLTLDSFSPRTTRGNPRLYIELAARSKSVDNDRDHPPRARQMQAIHPQTGQNGHEQMVSGAEMPQFAL